jgi:hypothetical protein
MYAKTQKPNPLHSARLLLWLFSGFYLLAMVCLLLLSSMGGDDAQEARAWLVPTVVAFNVLYGVLMLWLWPHEKLRPR